MDDASAQETDLDRDRLAGLCRRDSPAWQPFRRRSGLSITVPIWAAITGPLGIPIGGNLHPDRSRALEPVRRPLIPAQCRTDAVGPHPYLRGDQLRPAACRPRSWRAMAATICDVTPHESARRAVPGPFRRHGRRRSVGRRLRLSADDHGRATAGPSTCTTSEAARPAPAASSRPRTATAARGLSRLKLFSATLNYPPLCHGPAAIRARACLRLSRRSNLGRRMNKNQRLLLIVGGAVAAVLAMALVAV